MNEFELIDRFFNRSNKHDILGIGDDAAIVLPTRGYQLHISTDTLVSDRHFFSDVNPKTLGHKVLAVNLSDIAAMGAIPRWALLSLSIPKLDTKWLKCFAKGFFELADQFSVRLIGGDTVRATLSLTITIIGESLPNVALHRCNAKIGDDIWVSGTIGLAALALNQRLHSKHDVPIKIKKICQKKFDLPEPRIALGQALHGIANACIDISDGLLGDLSHILKKSQCGAIVWLQSIPSHSYIKDNIDKYRNCLLCGGDDYELLFTAPKNTYTAIQALSKKLDLSLTKIGEINTTSCLTVLDKFNQPIAFDKKGFDHFATY
jgi:thiamine-monophosphate kinase